MKRILIIALVFSLMSIACDSDNDCPTPVSPENASDLELKISDLEKQLISDYNTCEAKILEQENTITSLEWKLKQVSQGDPETSVTPLPSDQSALPPTPCPDCPECPECPECPPCPPCPTITPVTTPIPSPLPEPETQPTISSSPFARAISNALEYLEGPDKGYPELGNFDIQEELYLIGQFNNCRWLKVTTKDGNTGWILSQNAFLQYIDPLDSCEGIPNGTYSPFTYIISSDISDNGKGKLKVTNDLNSDIVVVLADTISEEKFVAFVQKGDSISERSIEKGSYDFYYATGAEWDDVNKLFTSQASYRRSLFEITYTASSDSYSEFGVTLEHGTNGEIPGTEIEAHEFPKL